MELTDSKMIYIIGGAKTGYNLYKFIKNIGVDVELYFFSQEFSQKRNIGKLYEHHWKGVKYLKSNDLLFVSSEKAFNNLMPEDYAYFKTHYFLRDKSNLHEISTNINTTYIEEIDINDSEFPLIVKPKESSSSKVPFKILKVNNSEELRTIEDLLKYCFVQPYLSDDKYSQIAVAGYFDGKSSSLIAVEQKKQYPKGISAYVVDRTANYKCCIDSICKYLNKLAYTGFIEFEFKKNKETNELYLMDINPRTWGWSYYYFDGIKNFRDVLFKGAFAEIKIKKSWINLPRLILASFKGEIILPSILDVVKKKVCYEPYFKK